MLSCADTIIGTVSVLYLGFLVLSVVSAITSTIAAGRGNWFTVDSSGIIWWISINEILLVTAYLMFVDRDILLRWICLNLPWCEDIKRFCCNYISRPCVNYNNCITSLAEASKVAFAFVTLGMFIGLIAFLNNGTDKGEVKLTSLLLSIQMWFFIVEMSVLLLDYWCKCSHIYRKKVIYKPFDVIPQRSAMLT